VNMNIHEKIHKTLKEILAQLKKMTPK